MNFLARVNEESKLAARCKVKTPRKMTYRSSSLFDIFALVVLAVKYFFYEDRRA